MKTHQFNLKYDDASWHSEGDFPANFPPEAGGTHIAMFLIWAWLNGLGGESFEEFMDEFNDAVESQKMSPAEILFAMCDGKLTSEDLNDEGNAFADAYYQDTSTGYLPDYIKYIAVGLPTIYHVQDTWENFGLVSHMISEKYSEWEHSSNARNQH